MSAPPAPRPAQGSTHLQQQLRGAHTEERAVARPLVTEHQREVAAAAPAPAEAHLLVGAPVTVKTKTTTKLEHVRSLENLPCFCFVLCF